MWGAETDPAAWESIDECRVVTAVTDAGGETVGWERKIDQLPEWAKTG
jgi:hypothetical protein